MPAQKPPLSRGDWIHQFTEEIARLRDIRPDGKYALALAAQEWIVYQDEDPVKVAQAWAKRASGQAGKPSSPLA